MGSETASGLRTALASRVWLRTQSVDRTRPDLRWNYRCGSVPGSHRTSLNCVTRARYQHRGRVCSPTCRRIQSML